MPLSWDLPALAVSGNRIVRVSDGAPALLRGINRSGMEYRSPAGEWWQEAEFDRIICDWGAGIIRIPFNQAWALAGIDGGDPLYLRSMDRAIELAARRGAYTLLALQWLDNITVRQFDSRGLPDFVPPLPDLDSIELWRRLATRYRSEPAVLYDILTEPHDVSMGDWQSWARTLVEVIRERHPAALIFISGVDWGYDLRGMPLSGIDGLVYSTHIYRNKGAGWDSAFGNLSATVPVFAAEWGGGDSDLNWGRDLAGYLAERGIGWTAWGWPDYPPLIDADYEPTRFGSLVRSLLSGT